MSKDISDAEFDKICEKIDFAWNNSNNNGRLAILEMLGYDGEILYDHIKDMRWENPDELRDFIKQALDIQKHNHE